MFKVSLDSELYDYEEFTYDSLEEAIEGLKRLAKASIKRFKQDHEEREITLYID